LSGLVDEDVTEEMEVIRVPKRIFNTKTRKAMRPAGYFLVRIATNRPDDAHKVKAQLLLGPEWVIRLRHASTAASAFSARVSAPSRERAPQMNRAL
jgi:hypothetical protein